MTECPRRMAGTRKWRGQTLSLPAFGHVCPKFGGRSVDLIESLRRLAAAAARFGPEAAEKALRALVDVADEPVILDALKNSGKLDECLEGLAVVAKSGLSPSDISAVLKNHANILSSTYTAEKLLLDTKLLGNIPGMDDLWKMLKTGNVQTKGFRYELEGAAGLARQNITVVGLSKRVSVALGKTDIDVIVQAGTQMVYYQFKRSTQALQYGNKGLNKAKLWVAKALQDLRAAGRYDLVKYAVPPGVRIPPLIDKWLKSRKPPIDIVRVLHQP